LALLGTAYWALATLRGVRSVVHRSDPDRIVDHADGKGFDYYPSGIWIGWTALTEVILATVLLLAGGILLLMRKQVGRWVIVAGCVAVLANVFHPLIVSDYWYSSFTKWDWITISFAVVTAGLALLSSTKQPS